jgi:hypothetical protein
MIRLMYQNYFCCVITVFLLMASISAAAQPLSFIHIQTEYNQPYEITWNGKNYPSSATGYLVIPQVPAGKHTLDLSYADETGTVTECRFTVEMANKPRGFSLRQAIDNNWSLFDMVDLTLLQGTIVVPEVKTVIPDVEPVVKEEKPVQKPVDPPTVKKEQLVAKEKTSMKPTGILKIFDKSGANGIDQVYIITNGAKSDTIALFIPVIEKNEPNTGSNPSAFIPYTEPSNSNTGKTIRVRPSYLVALSKQTYVPLFPGTIL